MNLKRLHNVVSLVLLISSFSIISKEKSLLPLLKVYVETPDMGIKGGAIFEYNKPFKAWNAGGGRIIEVTAKDTETEVKMRPGNKKIHLPPIKTRHISNVLKINLSRVSLRYFIDGKSGVKENFTTNTD